MEILRSVLRELPEFQQLLAALDSGQSPAAVSGLAAVHRAHFAACLGQESGRPVVVVCADAVSYTHLDVYKRQEGLRRFRRSVFLCEPCLKQVWEQDLDRLPPLPEDAGLWEG